MSWGAALVAALLIVLPRPATWIVALAAFLVRGGLLVFLVPIVVVPSPVDLGTTLGPTITAFVFGGLSAELALVLAAVFATFLAWMLVGGWAAGVTETHLIETVATDEDAPLAGAVRPPTPARRRGRVWRIVLLRIAGHVPLAVVLAWGSVRVIEAAYRELTVPGDVLVPIALRVVGRVPDAIVAIVAAWCLGEILGSIGARRLVLRGQSLDHAYLGAWADLLRRPVTAVATFAVPSVVLLLVVGPIALASGIAWDWLRTVLGGGSSNGVLDVLLALVSFVAIWAAGLVLAGLLAAWRSAAATVEAIRGRGTYGASRHRRPGDWPDPEPSGSL